MSSTEAGDYAQTLVKACKGKAFCLDASVAGT